MDNFSGNLLGFFQGKRNVQERAMYIFHEHARKMNRPRKCNIPPANAAFATLCCCATCKSCRDILGNFWKLRGNFKRVGVPVAGGGGFLGGTPPSLANSNMRILAYAGNRVAAPFLVSARYHSRTRQLAATPRYARKYLILQEVLALVACPGVSRPVVAPVPPVP